MFDSFSDRLHGVFRTLAGKSKFTESNVAEAMREVRVALLEADVQVEVARDFVARVKEQALGERVLKAVEPGQQFQAVIHEELVKLLGVERAEIHFASEGPTVIMLCGLQGCGKTTTAGKLARRFKEERRKPMLVAADIQRPAAIEQLQTLGKQLDVPVHAQQGGDPVRICKQALEVAKFQNVDTIILDTAGRLHVDEALMGELEQIRRGTNPHEILFVCDAMIGQSAVDTANEFKARLPLTGAIMTKLDSDARGGAALSLREVTGVPIKLIATGEKLDALDEFDPERMAGRILGMGDVVELVRKAQTVVDEKEAEDMRRKLEENEFNLDDFKKQLAQLRKMGSMKDLLGLIPGLGRALKNIDIPEDEFRRIEAILGSMTVEERKFPRLIEASASRQRRIAKGSGQVDPQGNPLIKPIRDLLKQFGEMKKMIGHMGKAGMFSGGLNALKGMMGMGEMLGGAAGGAPGGMPGLPPGGMPGMPPGGMPGMGGLFGSSKKSGTKSQQKKKRDKRKKQKKRRK